MSKQKIVDQSIGIAKELEIHDKITKDKQLEVFMGIDIGSVSLKIVLIDRDRNIIEKLWLRNQGSPIESSKKGLMQLKTQ